MAGEWIKLKVRPKDKRIIRISELTKVPRLIVYEKAIDWFFWVDANLTNEVTDLSLEGFHEVVGWEPGRGISLAAAMQDQLVGWLQLRTDGLLIVPEFDKHFSKSAKRRAVHADRVAESRALSVRNDAHPPSHSSSSSGFLFWAQYQDLYFAYPKSARASKGRFGRALSDGAWAVLEAQGEVDPQRALLPIVGAYAASWKVRTGFGVVGPGEFFAPSGEWTRDPSDWDEPGGGGGVPTASIVDKVTGRKP